MGIDVGGTFTDLVALSGTSLVTAKVPSTPRDQSDGVMRCLDAARVDSSAVVALAHGTTVATNALLERKGARTALVTTTGFRDILEIGRQDRPSLYDLHARRPPTLVPRELRFTVDERMGPNGPIKDLADTEIQKVVAELQMREVEAVAVCLLFGYLYPEHEQLIGRAVSDAMPEVHVSLSSEVLPEFREYERSSTTAAGAYLGPKLAIYLANLATRLKGKEIPAPLVMQSSGGVVGIDGALARPASCVLSGPAGGVVGAAHVGEASGYRDVLTFDMGGTSTDVAPVVNGRVGMTTESVVAGVPIKLPMVDVHTVSAGGGSIAWIDTGGALRVGPHSAGADPGPACYGMGGTEPTVTDANLWLGYIADGAELGGAVVLDRRESDRSLRRLSDQIGLDPLQVALGVIDVANAEMERALRVISVERGLDPRDFVLVAFGGAGPMHACALAENLGMKTVLVPKSSGVLSALGLAISDLRRDYVTPFLFDLSDVDWTDATRRFSLMEESGRAELGAPVFERSADMRYRGQSFELTVPADDVAHLGDTWHRAHERRYGYHMKDEAIEVVGLRVTARVPVEAPPLTETPAGAHQAAANRSAYFDGGRRDVPVYHRTIMGSGSTVEGPALIDFSESTCVVRSGWKGAVDSAGTLVLERTDA